MTSKRFDRFRVEFWWWWEHRRYDWPIGLSAYARRHRAERDVVHRYRENIYGQPFVCDRCGDTRYHR